jgi:hypothetical protein
MNLSHLMVLRFIFSIYVFQQSFGLIGLLSLCLPYGCFSGFRLGTCGLPFGVHVETVYFYMRGIFF